MKTFPFFTVLIVLAYNFAFAQIPTRSIPKGEISDNGVFNIKSSLSPVILPDINVQALLKEDEIDASRGIPPRFGKDINVDLGLMNSGVWSETDQGKVWKLLIRADNAFSINMIFDEFYLGQGAKLYIYNEDKTILMGPITNEYNLASPFATDLIKGSAVILELFEPKGHESKSKLHINKVIHGYKNIGYNGFGDSSPCNVDVRCPSPDLSNLITVEQYATAMMITADGTRFCSGTLLNNGCNDLTPNFLTAFHCIDSNEDGTLSSTEKAAIGTFVFRFNYISPECNGGENLDWLSFSGASFRAAWNVTDFALLLLNNQPTPESGIRYAGWARGDYIRYGSPNNKTPFVGYHHPQGDVMKESVDYDAPTSVSWPGGPANTHWRVKFEVGTVEPGSSGSGLFNRFGDLIGQLHGDQNNQGNYCEQRVGEYGRFDKSWIGGGTDQTRLSTWLTNDPNKLYQHSTGIPVISGGPGTQSICNTGNYSFSLKNDPLLGIQWSGTPGITVTTSRSRVVVTADPGFIGNAELIATIIQPNCDDLEFRKQLYVRNCASGSNYTLYPNPVDDELSIEYVSDLSNESTKLASNTDFVVYVYDSFNRVIIKEISNGGKVCLNTNSLSEGIYYLHMYNDEMVEKRRFIIKR